MRPVRFLEYWLLTLALVFMQACTPAQTSLVRANMARDTATEAQLKAARGEVSDAEAKVLTDEAARAAAEAETVKIAKEKRDMAARFVALGVWGLALSVVAGIVLARVGMAEIGVATGAGAGVLFIVGMALPALQLLIPWVVGFAVAGLGVAAFHWRNAMQWHATNFDPLAVVPERFKKLL